MCSAANPDSQQLPRLVSQTRPVRLTKGGADLQHRVAGELLAHIHIHVQNSGTRQTSAEPPLTLSEESPYSQQTQNIGLQPLKSLRPLHESPLLPTWLPR